MEQITGQTIRLHLAAITEAMKAAKGGADRATKLIDHLAVRGYDLVLLPITPVAPAPLPADDAGEEC